MSSYDGTVSFPISLFEAKRLIWETTSFLIFEEPVVIVGVGLGNGLRACH